MTFFTSIRQRETKTTTETRVKVYSWVKSRYPNIQTTNFLRVSMLQPTITSLIITHVSYEGRAFLSYKNSTYNFKNYNCKRNASMFLEILLVKRYTVINGRKLQNPHKN